jgi:hypothetical protein
LISMLIVSLVPGSDLAGVEPLQLLGVNVVSAPSTGAVTIDPFDGSIQYTPKRDLWDLILSRIKCATRLAPHHCAIRPL